MLLEWPLGALLCRIPMAGAVWGLAGIEFILLPKVIFRWLKLPQIRFSCDRGNSGRRPNPNNVTYCEY